MIAEVDDELKKLFGFGNVLDAFDGADANVDCVERRKGNGWLDRRGRNVWHGLSPETLRVCGNGDGWIATFIADRCIGDETERDNAGPHGKRIVFGVVFNRAGADFCRDFGERKLKDARCFEFFFIGLASIVPTARENFFRESPKGFEFFVWRLNKLCDAEGDDGAIVHGMIENRTGKDEAVGKSDGDADGNARGEIAQHAAGGGAVKIDRVADARVHGGDDVGLRIGCEADVANETIIENFVNLGTIVNGALRFADDACALGWCGGIGHGGHRDETKRRVDSRRSRHEWERSQRMLARRRGQWSGREM